MYRLHQKQYIIDILGYFDMLECEPAPTPFSTKMISAEDNAGDDEAQIRFMKDKNMRKLVGMLPPRVMHTPGHYVRGSHPCPLSS